MREPYPLPSPCASPLAIPNTGTVRPAANSQPLRGSGPDVEGLTGLTGNRRKGAPDFRNTTTQGFTSRDPWSHYSDLSTCPDTILGTLLCPGTLPPEQVTGVHL
ncbi:hypothetical protein AAFF_G00243180 [Aldrovandia affinis]|uniref:Uncharacterized protein n=1 Tax=Aldrovandia affinis TaxID=143900 RepID=A0AAD7REC9_9TELE|nr:hypothetical protein AAFF_G00243180 [Aldrovandia affinis]